MRSAVYICAKYTDGVGYPCWVRRGPTNLPNATAKYIDVNLGKSYTPYGRRRLMGITANGEKMDCTYGFSVLAVSSGILQY